MLLYLPGVNETLPAIVFGGDGTHVHPSESYELNMCSLETSLPSTH